MAYIYCATLYCDACGADLARTVPFPDDAQRGDGSTWDSDDYPKSVGNPGESDSPTHCDATHDCLGDNVDLRAWGLKDSDPLYGAECPRIGELVGDDLTPDGVDYLRELLGDCESTPYQRALHAFWSSAFSDYL